MKSAKEHGRAAGAMRLARMARMAGMALFAASIVNELRKPKSERTWRGTALGFVPYDFRPPTLARLKEAFWNPDDRHLLTARPLGVGWAINFYEVRRRLMPKSGGGGGDAGIAGGPALLSPA